MTSTRDMTASRLLCKAEVLSGLRNFWDVDRPEHYSIDYGKTGGKRKWPVFLPSRSGMICVQLCTDLRTMLGKLLRDGAEHVWTFPNVTMPS